MEEQEKKETLSKLYSLRAGLSVLSDENQKAKDAESERNDQMVTYGNRFQINGRNCGSEWASQSMWDTAKMVRQAADLVSSEKALLESRLEAEKHLKEFEDEKTIKEAEETKKTNKMSKFMGPIFMVAGVIAFIVWIYAGIHDKNMAESIAIGLLIGGGLFLVGVLVLIGAFSKKKEKQTQQIQTARSREVTNNIRSLQIQVDELDKIVPAIRAELKKYEREYSDKIKPIGERATAYYRILREEFSPLLDERDWQHLDLIIFYFETGRADSMKEALSMVDRELQTDRIVDAVNQAARAICSSIERQTEVLQRTMVACCVHLSEQLSSIGTQLAVQNAQLSGLLDATRMNNSLLRHANDSSKQLYEDATRVCHLIEAREIRRIS